MSAGQISIVDITVDRINQGIICIIRNDLDDGSSRMKRLRLVSAFEYGLRRAGARLVSGPLPALPIGMRIKLP